MIQTKRSLLLTFLVVAMLAIAGCGGGDDPTPAPASASSESAPGEAASGATPVEATTNSESTTASTTGAESNAVVSSTGNAATDAVAAALRNQLASLPMRMTMSAAGESEAMVSEMASPTRFRINAAGMELMVVDGTVYMNMNGAWVANDAMGETVNAMMGQFTAEAIEEQVNTIATAELLPDETVNGEDASVYQFTVDLGEGLPASTSKLYVRKSDGLPIRVTSGDGEDGAFQVDYEYDPTIVIEAPQ